MSWSRRLVVLGGFLIQLVLALISKATLLMFLAILVYMLGLFLLNAMLTAEFVRKTQMEADQIAAEKIQQTLQPQKLDELRGYRMQMYYKPLREVGGDYFDVIERHNGQTLLL